MNKSSVSRNLGCIALCLMVYLAGLGVLAQDPAIAPQNVSPLPSPTAPVNDYAGVIDDAVEAALNQRLIDYQRSSGVELAVAVVKTTGERPIFDYSLAVYRGWGIGSKGPDNPGALLLVAVDDRKYFTQVSRDLEDELPDAVVGNLQKQHLVPEFRAGNYGKGIADTIEAYIRTIEERSSGTAASPTPVPRRERPGTQSGFPAICCLIVIGLIILMIFSNRGGRSGRGGSGWGGGGFGGGASVLPWIIGSAISNAASSSSSGWGSGGSDWGGGGSDWGGGGGWGGFGGGGDAGGGGAGGDW